MGKFIDLSGQKYGKLTVIKRLQNNTHKGSVWLCKCDCGNIVNVWGNCLRSGNTKSCGCLRKEQSHVNGINNIKHGMTDCRLYYIWSGMKSRCYYKQNKCYNIYGKRGIKICDEWLDKNMGFVNFFNWSLHNGYNDDLTIDRINSDGDYEPSNCRWVTRLEQSNNLKTNNKITYKHETKTISEWARYYNIKRDTLYYRLKQGWSIEKALLTPTRIYNRGERNNEQMGNN